MSRRYDEEPLGGRPETEAERAEKKALADGILGTVRAVNTEAGRMTPEEARRVLTDTNGVTAETRVAAEVALGQTGRGVLGVFARLLGSGSSPSRWSKHDEM